MGMDSYFSSSAVKVQLSHAYRKVVHERPHQLSFRSKETFLSLHIGFSLERVDVIWAILESIPGLDPAFELTDPRLKHFTSSRL